MFCAERDFLLVPFTEINLSVSVSSLSDLSEVGKLLSWLEQTLQLVD
jgi:hypothetical protein